MHRGRILPALFSHASTESPKGENPAARGQFIELENIALQSAGNIDGLECRKRGSDDHQRMAARQLFLAAYDIGEARRLRKALDVMKQYATGGQKSVFECFLTAPEKGRLVAEIAQVIEPSEDRFFLIPIGAEGEIRILGIAVQPSDPPFYYAG